MATPEAVFEEWDAYAQKRQLQDRMLDLDALKEDAKRKIVALTGIRRSGKTSVLILLRQHLAAEGKDVAYVNLEDSRINNVGDGLDQVIKWFGDEGYILLDEITNAQGWEEWLARTHEMLKENLYLIVSSSRKTLATPAKPLRGRILPTELYPLSFREFLAFNNISVEYTTAGIGRIERALKGYLLYGGFPEVVLAENKTEKIRILNTYFRDIVGLDVAELSGVDITTVETFGKYVLASTYFSASKCLNFFKSAGFKIGKQSLLKLEKCAQESYLFFFVPIFSHTIKDRTQYPRKAYMGDTGFLNAITGKTDMGRLYENVVFLALKRALPQNRDIHYWKGERGEVDFVIREGTETKQLIQVVYDLGDEETETREVSGLIECANECGCEDGRIITRDVEEQREVGGVTIHFIPLWKWLISSRD